jgi:RNA polymerase sigma-70 factor, ECF subfamily
LTRLDLTTVLAARMPSTFAPRAKALYPAVWRCLRRFGVPDPDLDDALQAVLLALHRRWADLQALPKADLQNYACCVAASVARRAARTRQRFASVPLEEDLVHGAEDPELRAESREALAQLDAILANIEPDEREIFVLYEIEGLTGTEIATNLGIPYGTVVSRLRRAREDFRKALKRDASQSRRPRP